MDKPTLRVDPKLINEYEKSLATRAKHCIKVIKDLDKAAVYCDHLRNIMGNMMSITDLESQIADSKGYQLDELHSVTVPVTKKTRKKRTVKKTVKKKAVKKTVKKKATTKPTTTK